MKVALFTSDSLRHKYIATALAKEMDLIQIISESKSNSITDTSSHNSEDADFIKTHFDKRERKEKEFFGAYKNFPRESELLEIDHNEINGFEVFNLVKEKDPDIIILFGTSIIKDPLLSYFDGRIINIHLGLSPYYRGSATNLFPYYYDEPECIGATIHLATARVDEGPVLYQIRPNIIPKSTMHDIGNTVILMAGLIIPQVIKAYTNNELSTVIPSGVGRVCRNKDLSPQILHEIYTKFEKGMIKDYLLDKAQRDLNKPIYEPELPFFKLKNK